jgi:hypothetical protein
MRSKASVVSYFLFAIAFCAGTFSSRAFALSEECSELMKNSAAHPRLYPGYSFCKAHHSQKLGGVLEEIGVDNQDHVVWTLNYGSGRFRFSLRYEQVGQVGTFYEFDQNGFCPDLISPMASGLYTGYPVALDCD